LETFYANTAEFISNICCVLNPGAVVIGGGVSKAGDRLLEGIRRHMDRFLFHAVSNVQLSLATLGNDAGAIRAFRMILPETN
jgi:glucokinase